MHYVFSELTIPSSDGIHNLYTEIYAPMTGEVKGVIQLAHGMIDHVGRYKALAEFFAAAGYVFAGHHHLGHGKTVNSADEYGYFAKRHGVSYLVGDMHRVNLKLRELYPSLPITVLGHSMGSFITRLYAVAYPEDMEKVIIHGTGGPNPLLPMGKFVAGAIRLFRGGKHRSKLITGLAFGSYNSRFPESDGKNAWLTRDVARVSDRKDDELLRFIFTTSGYLDLFTMIGKVNSRAWFKAYPKDMPTLVISGDADPVGNYGKGPIYVYDKLVGHGVGGVELKMYEGARHELFNETNSDEVFRDLLIWVEK
ncbi:MAG: alpha/beta fold hydrolase [Clostridia bacterium]|nr:alpha/beta fold hydrolase [Clostridia bacterium]